MTDIRLERTCGACPEQYDAFVGEEQVGYLRLRDGHFRVDFPHCGGETIYEASPRGDGIFDENERDHYLSMARAAISRRLHGTPKVVLVTGDESVVNDFPPEVWEQCERIVLPPEDFDWLVGQLNREPRDLPKLRELLSRPSVFDYDESTQCLLPPSLAPREGS